MGSSVKKIPFKKIKADIHKEYMFLKNVFSAFNIPQQMKGETDESMLLETEESVGPQSNTEITTTRARTITDLEEKLNKIKSDKKFTLKSKYIKKSLTSKINKKIKKKQRLAKITEKPVLNGTLGSPNQKEDNVNVAKPVFNNDGKLVFSKFDFANLGNKEKTKKTEKDPKKLLENLKKQDEKVKLLEKTDGTEKAHQVMDKLAWKNILKKAEGEKVKDDPVLLKKSIKKMEQKKKQSKKKWDERKSNVEQKLQERQKKRQENISKKKKEKKAKIVKASAKRGRVVI